MRRVEALIAAWLLAACGTSAAAPQQSGCPEGATYCAACGGDGFCSQGGCPNVVCPDMLDAGGDAAGDASGNPSGALCGAGQVSCAACSGGAYCASGHCPATTCPVDAGNAVAGACDGSLCGYCPATPPANGSSCPVPAGIPEFECTWGDHPAAVACRTIGTCAAACASDGGGGPPACDPVGRWTVNPPSPLCAGLETGCPSAPTGDCTASARCFYPDGKDCECAPSGPPSCSGPLVVPPPCPSQVPNEGTTCSLPSGTQCVATPCGGLCGFSLLCQDGVWHWLQDCSCHSLVCASPDTPIATPEGERRIADIRVGDLVYSVDDDAIRPVFVTRVRRQAAEHHHVVRVTVSGGRTLEISAPHPTADGRTFGDLRAGARLDGQFIESVEVIGYAHEFTYDILPGSETGTYFAAGMQIGSTLR